MYISNYILLSCHGNTAHMLTIKILIIITKKYNKNKIQGFWRTHFNTHLHQEYDGIIIWST